MIFSCYYKEYELPFLEKEYKIISDKNVFAYYYCLDNEYYFSVWVEENTYATFICKNAITDESILLNKAHEINSFYRETIGLQSSHISSSTIREIEALCKFNEASIANFENSITINQISLEIKHKRNNNIEWWGIVCNNKLLLSLTSESAINRIIRVIEYDIISYILKRWGRLKKPSWF